MKETGFHCQAPHSLKMWEFTVEWEKYGFLEVQIQKSHRVTANYKDTDKKKKQNSILTLASNKCCRISCDDEH